MDLGGSQQTDKHLFDDSAKGERIATPVCALVRNDRLDTADDRPISIYLTIVPTATPCVPLERGRSLVGGADDSSINIWAPLKTRTKDENMI